MLRGFLMAVSFFNANLRDCSYENSIAKIESMEIDPIKSKPGDISTTWVAYDLSKEVTGGYVNYSYWWNFRKFEPVTVDICSIQECPIEPACYNVSTTSIFPGIPDHIEYRIEWFNQDNQPIWCVDVIYDV